ncbi:MAG: hypothetical protein Q9198_007388 [Flavoplaca austrocitrina]
MSHPATNLRSPQGDEDCHCDRIHISPTALFDSSFLDDNYTDSADKPYECRPDIRTPKRRKEYKTPYKPHNGRADLYDLINAGQWEWKYLIDELEGHDDWFLAWDALSEFMKLGTKLSGINILLHRLQREEMKGDKGVEELDEMMKEGMVELENGSWRSLGAFRERWEDPEEPEDMDW